MNHVSSLMPKVEVDGWPINIENRTELIKQLTTQLEFGQTSFMVCTLNLDHLVTLRRNASFREAYGHADYVTADGFPIVTLARLSGSHIERTTGADLIKPMCELAAEHNFPIFLMGSTLRTLCACAAHLVSDHPRLDIRGVFSPPHGFDPTSTLADEIIETIERSGARICCVALGAPRQEIFCARALAKTSHICFLPIGAALDFIAGTQERSPNLLQRLNLEWAWRLAHDPRRLFGRYLRCAILLFGLLRRHYLAGLFVREHRLMR